MYDTIKEMKDSVEAIRARLHDSEVAEALNKISEGIQVMEWHVA
jgi:hypothetical protein